MVPCQAGDFLHDISRRLQGRFTTSYVCQGRAAGDLPLASVLHALWGLWWIGP